MGKHSNNRKGGGSGSPEEEMGLPTCPGWMVTFGDMSGLLMAFFVMMVAFSSVEKGAFEEAMTSIQSAMGILPYGQSAIKFDQVPAVRLSPPLSPKQIMERIRAASRMAGVGGAINVMQGKEGIRITIQSPILFDSAKADLRPEALSVLDELVKILAESPVDVVVEGHTDNLPIHTDQFPSNWELSTARAISVTRYLFEKGSLDATGFTVAGYAEFHPLASNETAEGRQKNRRVEILLKDVAQSKGSKV